MNKAIFVPANSRAFPSLWKRGELYADQYDYKWFTKDSFFRYPWMLENAYYSKDINVRKDFGYPDNYKLIGDSGGFQIQSFAKKGKKISIEPIRILRWLESNVDIGMNLDIPPWTNFNASLKQSVTNFDLFERERQNYSMKLYNILHGRTLSDATQWYEQAQRFDFDGWAIGIKPSRDHLMQLTGYLLLRDADAPNLDNLHYFGISDTKNALMLSMVAQKFGHDITYDSSSWVMGDRYRHFYYPYSTRFKYMFGRANTHTTPFMPCSCPVCSKADPTVMCDSENLAGGHLIALHNLYMYISMSNLINNWAGDRTALIEFAKYLGEADFVQLIYEILDKYDSHNAAWIYERYKRHPLFTKWKDGTVRTTQSDLFTYGGIAK